MSKQSSQSNNANFKDHFSHHAAKYAQYRPSYPEELFAFLANICPDNTRVWDCATGSGQSAISLATHFQQVIATDASEEQILHATSHQKIDYHVAPAENSGLDNNDFDLICVAQAVHWFDLNKFYDECRRVAKSDGLLALWCYELFNISPQVDQLVAYLYEEMLGPFWPQERRLIEKGYRTIPFPFEEIETPTFDMSVHWSFDQVMGYLQSWSASQKYFTHHGKDPVELILSELKEAWGSSDVKQKVSWPLNLRVGVIS